MSAVSCARRTPRPSPFFPRVTVSHKTMQLASPSIPPFTALTVPTIPDLAVVAVSAVSAAAATVSAAAAAAAAAAVPVAEMEVPWAALQ